MTGTVLLNYTVSCSANGYFSLLYFTFINSPKLLCGNAVSRLSISGSEQNPGLIGKGRLCSLPAQRASLSAGCNRDTCSSSAASAGKNEEGIRGLVELKSVLSTRHRDAGSEL